jgi:peptidoglycan hydrolase-like protein with peptidoglycan-binding domain
MKADKQNKQLNKSIKQKNMNTNIKTIAVTSVLALAISLLSVGVAQANGYYIVSADTPLTNQMGIGSTGSDVSKLQTFLASNSDLYSGGLVTGYFGPLTNAAVIQYQLGYGISPVGHVGPVTLASMNNTMARGYGIDVYGSTIYGTSVSTTSNSATINWTATGYNSGKVFYSTSPISAIPAVGQFTAPIFVGATNVSTAYSQLGQSVVIGGLQSGTRYYYIIQVADASGNVSVTNTMTFMTN